MARGQSGNGGDEIGADGQRDLGRTGWRGCATIGGKVDQCPVRLVANGGDKGDGRGGGGAHHGFVIEAPEIFQASTPARDDNEIGTGERTLPVQPGYSRGDLRAARFALHAHRPYDEVDWKAIAHAVDDVSDHRTGRRRDDTDRARHGGEGTLALLREQPFRRQLRLALLQQRHQCTGPGGLQRFDDQLVLGAIGRHLAGGDDLHALLGLELELPERALPDYRVDPRAIFRQREVRMPRRMRPAVAGDLAPNADVTVGILERTLHRPRDLRNGKLRDVRAGTGAGDG